MGALATGPIYITGGFWDTRIFGMGLTGETELSSAGELDVFLMRLELGSR